VIQNVAFTAREFVQQSRLADPSTAEENTELGLRTSCQWPSRLLDDMTTDNQLRSASCRIATGISDDTQ
jgi:hypothetical protein